MKMYKCCDCGHLFEDGEQAVWNEDRGEFWGSPCTESVSGCPVCKGDYVEVEPCQICGGYEHEEYDKFCDDCRSNVLKRFKTIVFEKFTEAEIELLKEIEEDGLL